MFFDLLHVRIRIKLLGLVLLPVVGGGLLSGLVVAEQTRLLERMQRLRAASSLSVSVGNVVHALQAESAGTALYLGSEGMLQAPMAKGREAVDHEQAGLNAALSEAGPEFKGVFPAPLRDGSHLKDLRRRADRHGASLELIDDYAREVDALLRVQNQLMLPAAGTPLESRFQAFTTLIRAKESAGLEAAVLAHVFSHGTLDVATQERFLSLLDAQKAQGEAFLSSAPEAVREDYKKALAGPFSAELQRMRDLVQAGRVIEDPEAWARVAAEELQALKGVQDRMSQDLLADAQGLERGARTKGWFLAAGFSVFGLVVLLWTWRATVLITEPIHALADGMARMQQGDLSIQLPVHSFDETGRMTETFNAMSAHLSELVRTLQSQATRVASGAGRWSTSVEQISSATQQLAKSSRVQREASEDVAAAVTQLQATVVQVRASVDAMIDGGREAAGMVRDTGRRAQLLHQVLEEVAKGGDAMLLARLREGAAQAAAIIQAMAQVNDALSAIEAVGGEIHKAAEAQSSVSSDVSHRMKASQAATGEVQLAAAQLANTAPELAITTRDLVSVAQSLKASAATFRVE
ncbi:methyl-accepting chemotaxis protein [Geothrix fuzhouensis]|uniref:methyl-accepting chemotaxis protein n=1 Tax=Geothrix fuzhouensis TaxID=2966451 RepID=UPI002148CA64|nr:methyl-accepting chemotaxis protein [Geothrix fuzhouensis]